MALRSSARSPYDTAMLNEDYALAQKIAQELVKNDPADPNALIALAHAQFMLGDRAEATSNYDKAIEVAPKNTIALYSRGLVAQEQDDFETAKEFYERALEVDKNYPDAHYGMAAACEGIGLPNLVIHHATRFLELSPPSSLADQARDMIKLAREEMAADQ